MATHDIAALVAKGETWVQRLYHLDRGYERLEEKLQLSATDNYGSEAEMQTVDDDASEPSDRSRLGLAFCVAAREPKLIIP